MHEFDETRWTSISRQSQKAFQSLILVFLYTVVVVAEKRGKPFQDDKKSNKSFSYSRHGQNYEHFLLPFPSFSNQSCWLIPKAGFLAETRNFLGFYVCVQIERIPNCQTHHVRSSTLASDLLCEVLYFPLLLLKLFQYLNSCTVDWTLLLLLLLCQHSFLMV